MLFEEKIARLTCELPELVKRSSEVEDEISIGGDWV